MNGYDCQIKNRNTIDTTLGKDYVFYLLIKRKDTSKNEEVYLTPYYSMKAYIIICMLCYIFFIQLKELKVPTMYLSNLFSIFTSRFYVNSIIVYTQSL